jgi:hypothetical protein
LQKSKTHPPKVPPSFGEKPEKLGSRTATSGRVGEGSQDFCKRSTVYSFKAIACHIFDTLMTH